MTSSSHSLNFLRKDQELSFSKAINNHQPLIEKPINIRLTSINANDVLHLSDLSLQSSDLSRARIRNKTPTRESKSRRPIHSPTSTISIDYYDIENNDYHHYRHRHRYAHQQYQDQQEKKAPQLLDLCDMRLFIIRHGERVDRYFGSNWFLLAFDQYGQYRPYHTNFPADLPARSNPYYWAFDTPLTRDGLSAAENVGRVLSINQYHPTYVYASPAMRCILTTYQILKGLGLDKKIAIRIEPGLLELGAARFGMEIFFKSIDWYNYGVNVDLSYQPIMTVVPPIEREDAYYLRSKYVIREIEQRHDNTDSSLHNILIVGHATSHDTLTWDLVGRQPNIYDLFALSLNIGYLQMVITERKRQNKLWSLAHVPLQSTTLKWV